MTQYTREDLAHMTSEEIARAHDNGEFAQALGMTEADANLIATDGPLNRDDIRRLAELGRHDLIVAAHENNRINY